MEEDWVYTPIFLMLVNLGPEGLRELALEFEYPFAFEDGPRDRVSVRQWIIVQGQRSHFIARLKQLNASPNLKK